MWTTRREFNIGKESINSHWPSSSLRLENSIIKWERRPTRIVFFFVSLFSCWFNHQSSIFFNNRNNWSGTKYTIDEVEKETFLRPSPIRRKKNQHRFTWCTSNKNRVDGRKRGGVCSIHKQYLKRIQVQVFDKSSKKKPRVEDHFKRFYISTTK